MYKYTGITSYTFATYVYIYTHAYADSYICMDETPKPQPQTQQVHTLQPDLPGLESEEAPRAAAGAGALGGCAVNRSRLGANETT